MTQRNVSVNVLGVELSTSNIPKNGINLRDLDERSREILAVFDTKDKNGKKVASGDGYLSAAEIRDAISLFNKYDIKHKNPAYEYYMGEGESEDLGKRYLNKDGYIDKVEAENMKEYINQRYEELGYCGIPEDVSVAGDVLDMAETLKKAMSPNKKTAQKSVNSKQQTQTEKQTSFSDRCVSCWNKIMNFFNIN